MAEDREDERGDLQGALVEMHNKNVSVYQHAGVELLRVPGEEKLRVRTTKEPTTAAGPTGAEPVGAVVVGEGARPA